MTDEIRKILREYAKWNFELAEQGGGRGSLEIENGYIRRIIEVVDNENT